MFPVINIAAVKDRPDDALADQAGDEGAEVADHADTRYLDRFNFQR